MKRIIPVVAALILGCVSCVEVNYELGKSTLPADNTGYVCKSVSPLPAVYLQRSDSLTGYSSTRITFGSVRDDVFGLTKRSAVLTIVPMHDSLDFGINPVVRRFHFGVAADTVSLSRLSDAHILQNVHVYSLTEPVDPLRQYGCDADIRPDRSRSITKGVPVVNGTDSLTFDFTDEFASRFLSLSKRPEMLRNMDKYLKEFPGIYIETDNPVGEGGRINMCNLQLGFNSSEMILTGNLARLTIETEYEGWSKRADTSFYFYLGPDKFYNVDSLLTKSASGSFPQYCLNLATSEKSKDLEGEASDRITVEGGNGVKPVIKASDLYHIAYDAIAKELDNHGVPRDRMRAVVINKATLRFPFEFPSDYREMFKYPAILSPTLRSHVTKKRKNGITGEEENFRVRVYASITDSSSGKENQGNINRNPDIMAYEPDITYYMQSLILNPESKLESGDYDIWMMIQAKEKVVTTSSNNVDMNEYYQYLAYQNYYGSMYGGGGYNDYYNNYYSYMMAAMSAGGTTSTTSLTVQVDKERYYNAVLNGVGGSDTKGPELVLVFTVPAA